MNYDLIAKAEEQKKKIQAALDDIRDSATFINTITNNKDTLKVSLVVNGNNIYLDRLMSNELAEANKMAILHDIDRGQEEKEKDLMRILKIPAVENQNFKKAVEEMVSSSNKKEDEDTQLREDEMLRKLYVDEDKQLSEVAAEMGLSPSKVRDRLKKYGIPSRLSVAKSQIKEVEKNIVDKSVKISPANFKLPERQEKVKVAKFKKTELDNELRDGKTVHELATKYGITKKQMYYEINKAGLSTKMYKPC